MTKFIGQPVSCLARNGVFGLFLMFFWIVGIPVTGCKRADSRQSVVSPAVTASPRIAVLSPAAGIIVRDLGFEDRVVARHAFDAIFSKDIPAAGDQAGINYEALIRVEPTLIITQWGARTLPEKLTTLAQERGWTLLDVNPLSLEQIADATIHIGAAITDDGAVADRANELAAQVRACGVPPVPIETADDTSSRLARVKVLLLFGVSPMTALGPGSCHFEMLVGAGGEPSLKDGLAFQSLTSEDIIRLAPDAIMLFDPKPADDAIVGTADAVPSDVWKPLRRLELTAVENGRLAVIDDPLCLMPSTSMIGVSKEMRECVERWVAEKSNGR